MSDDKVRPVAFRLDNDGLVSTSAATKSAPVMIVDDVSDIPDDVTVSAAMKARPKYRGFRFGALLMTGLGGLVLLSLGLWVAQVVEGLFRQALGLGYVGLAMLALALVGLIGVAWREANALLRQREISKLNVDFGAAYLSDDRSAARALTSELVGIYRERPEMAKGRAEVVRAMRDIVDGRDLIAIAERALLAPLDERAKHVVAHSAKRVSMVTAISPRAILDFFFAAGQIVYIVRRIAEIYGGRPGLFEFFRVLRSVVAHLTVTGGMVAADNAFQQTIGHTITAKISAKAGEALLNGMMTTRVGIAAINACRPAPFLSRKPPGIKDVAPFLFRGAKDGDA